MQNQLLAQVTVSQLDGWHARPATEFARIVGEFGLEVTIGRPGEEPVRGDSVLSLLTIGARFNETLDITVKYPETEAENAQRVVSALRELF